jgi:hypothetical protein
MPGGSAKRRTLRWIALGGLLVVAAYGAYPYATLYRLDRALEAHDTATLDAIIDWPSLRSHLRDDILAQAASRLLPGDKDEARQFGVSLLSAFGAALIDAAAQGLLTSEALARVYEERRRAGERTLLHSIDFAFFRALTSFDVEITTRREGTSLRFRMMLEGFEWRVTRLVLRAARRRRRVAPPGISRTRLPTRPRKTLNPPA